MHIENRSRYLVHPKQPKMATQEKQIGRKYILVGIMIEVYLIENGVKKQCIGRMPVKTAPPEVIAQIENLTIADMIMINDLRNKNANDLCDKNLPKEITEYEKHFDYEK